MKGHNKRSIAAYFPSPTSKPLLQKKTDAKATPNKTIQEEIGHLQQENCNTTDSNVIDNDKNPDFCRIAHGSDRWCASKHKCSNKNEQATSRRKCANCLGCTHLECFGKFKKALCLPCEEEKIPASTLTTYYEANNNEYDNMPRFGTSIWCAAQEQCTNKTNGASNLYTCYQCSLNVHTECIERVMINEVNCNVCLWCAELLELEQEYEDSKETSKGNINESMYSETSTDSTNIAITNEKKDQRLSIKKRS
jgi:hypothetical protein